MLSFRVVLNLARQGISQSQGLRPFSSAAAAQNVEYSVGNTYKRIPSQNAELDRSGQHKKIHDWELCLDISKGNPDTIKSVTFDLGQSFNPTSFVCSSPVKVKKPDGKSAWRFSTRQQSYATGKTKITVAGTGGTLAQEGYTIKKENSFETRSHFTETKPIKTLQAVKVAKEQQFGIELELTSTRSSLEDTAGNMTSTTGGRLGRFAVIRDYSEAQSTSQVWRMVPDSSIVCNQSAPNCETFELVSPILYGEEGLQQASEVLNALRSPHSSLHVNKSMGFHVHVDVSSICLANLIKVCQNFIKYEDVMDALVPPSRRTGSEQCNKFFRSNRHDMAGSTNKDRHQAAGACVSIEELAALMNAGGEHSKYYKLNLQNLVSGRQSTIEFRQHSATSNQQKVQNWARLCIAMVRNSARLRPPTPFREGRGVDFQFDAFFQYVIKDRALQKFYAKRRKDLNSGVDDDCCDDCN